MPNNFLRKLLSSRPRNNRYLPSRQKMPIAVAPPQRKFYRAHHYEHLDLYRSGPLFHMYTSLQVCMFHNFELGLRQASSKLMIAESYPFKSPHDIWEFVIKGVQSQKSLLEMMQDLYGHDIELGPNRPLYFFELTTEHQDYLDVAAPDAAERLMSKYPFIIFNERQMNTIDILKEPYWPEFQFYFIREALGPTAPEERGERFVIGSPLIPSQRTDKACKILSRVFGEDLFNQHLSYSWLNKKLEESSDLERAEIWLEWARFDAITFGLPPREWRSLAVLDGDQAYIDPKLLKVNPTPVAIFDPQISSIALIEFRPQPPALLPPRISLKGATPE